MRVATLGDVPEMHALIERSVRALQVHDYSPRQMDGALGHTLGLDTQLIADQTYFVASPSDDRKLIAGCGGWSFRRTTFGSDGGPNRQVSVLDPERDAAKIRAIFVHPAYARRGVGSLILAYCERAAQAAGFSCFEMGSTLTGVSLYQRKGYEETSRLNVPLPNGEILPIVMMRKSGE